MKLPNSGRVVIIDDTYSEAKPLIQLFGKNNIPYYYYEGTPDDLPDEPIKGVRFVFLDIELEGLRGQSVKNIASALTTRLKKIIGVNNGPYLIVFWTKHPEIIDQVIVNCKKIKIQPIAHVDLEKSICKNKDGNFDIGKITKQINKKLKKTKAFQLYTEWENIVNHSCSDFTQAFSSLTPVDDNWSKNTAAVFYKLYKSYVDKNITNNADIQFKLACSLLNRSFSDTLDRNTTEHLKAPDGFKIDNGTLDLNIISKINTSLFISYNPIQKNVSGNVYILNKKNNEKHLESLKSSLFKQGKVPDACKLCRITITPDCDIAQNKTLKRKDNKIHRVLYGLMCSAEISSNARNDRGKDAVFDIGPLWVDNKTQIIVMHFGTISFWDESDSDGTLKFGLRRDLLFDLQSKAANHVNRLGNFQLGI